MNESTPKTTTAETVHLPRLFVPDRCMEKCGKLTTVAALATLEAASDTTKQIDVVCHGAGKVLYFCGARRIESGTYGNSFGADIEGEENGYFLPNPVLYQTGSGRYTVQDKIARAVEEGSTAHSVTEL